MHILVAAKSYRGINSDQSPLAASLMQSNNGNAGVAPGDNECGVSNFKDTGAVEQGQAPYVADCKSLLDTIREDQDWEVTSTQTVIVTYGTCGFQVSTRNGQNDPDAEIGNADIIDLVTDSIKKFEKDEVINCEGDYVCLVSAKGTMPCEQAENGDTAEQVRVDWKILKV